MPYYDVANLVNVTKTNMIDEMPSGYRPLRTTGVRIWRQVFRRPCAEISAAPEVSRRPAQRSQQLHNLTILIVKFRSILNAPPSLQVLSGGCENPLAESESTLQSSRGRWEHLEVLRSTAEGYWSGWEVCVWLPDRITFCWCSSNVSWHQPIEMQHIYNTTMNQYTSKRWEVTERFYQLVIGWLPKYSHYNSLCTIQTVCEEHLTSSNWIVYTTYYCILSELFPIYSTDVCILACLDKLTKDFL